MEVGPAADPEKGRMQNKRRKKKKKTFKFKLRDGLKFKFLGKQLAGKRLLVADNYDRYSNFCNDDKAYLL